MSKDAPLAVTWWIRVEGADWSDRAVGYTFLWRGPRYQFEAKDWARRQPEVQRMKRIDVVEVELEAGA